ncbi:MAG: ROK family protein [Dehalococcoidia bacterium]|jgi:glucokinase
MARSEKPVVAVDLGGTKYIAAVIGPRGKILSHVYCPTLSHEGPDKIISRLLLSVDAAVREAGFKLRDMAGLGVAVAGIIDINRGLITEAPNLPGWHNIPFRDLLKDEFKIPVFMLNDASASALGEHRLGAGRGLDNLIYMTVSTGIGGGMIINGELYNGSDGSAAEVGHMIIQVDGPLCHCGHYGCLEAMASGTAIARMAQERLRSGWASPLAKSRRKITAEDVAAAVEKGDELASQVIDEAAGYLGIGMANLVNLFNPQMIVVGGGVSAMGERLLRPARKSMKKHAFKLPAGTVRIVRTALKADSGLIGAAIYARQQAGGKP